MTRHALALSAIICLSASTFCHAKPLTPTQALARISTEHSSRSASAVLVHTESHDGSPAVYVFQQPFGGYLVASADDVALPLLGYSDSGTFNSADIPENIKWWLSTYAGQISAAAKLPGTESRAGDGDSETQTQTQTDSLTPVDPILTTIWAQTSPFNTYTPVISGQHAPTGCVATAIAQCMYQYKYPDKGRGSTSYTSTYGSVKHTLALDFDTITFDWDDMIPNYWEPHTTAQSKAVATLMYALGVAFHMQYDLTGSSGDYMTAAAAMIKYFNYSDACCYYEREYFDLADWQSKIHSELVKGYPVPYSGSNNAGGHAFVADGYKPGGYFHINWGWGGEDNGWFLLSALNPYKERLTQTQGGYDMGQAIITGLVPPSDEPQPAIELRVSGNFSAQQASYTRSSTGSVTFHCQNGIFSMAATKCIVTLGVKMEDAEGNITYAGSAATNSFIHFQATQNFMVPMSALPTQGSYTVSPAFRDSVGIWHDILIPLTDVRYIDMDVTPTKISFVKSDEIPQLTASAPEMQSPLMIGERFSVTSTIQNTGTEFYDEVWPLLMQNGTIVAHGPGMNIDLLEDDTQTFNWVGTLSAVGGHTLTPGTYQMVIANSVNYSYVTLSPATTVTLKAKSTAPLFFTATAADVNGTPGSATSADSPAVITDVLAQFSFSISCTQGYFGQDVAIYVFNADDADDDTNPTYQYGEQFVGLEADQTKGVTVTADLSQLPAGTVFRAVPWSSTSGQLTSTPAYFRIGSAGVEPITPAEPVVSERVYDLYGRPASANSSRGIYILKRKFADGTIRTLKTVR